MAGFPDTIPSATTTLATAITDADKVQAWTDGIFNASVALPAGTHTGVLPKAVGYHHYPKPIVDIATFKYDDFELFLTDEENNPVAVTPVDRRGSGNGAVQVAWADPHTALGQQQLEREQAGHALMLPETHPVAKAAFIHQT